MKTVNINIKWESDRVLPETGIEYNNKLYNFTIVDGDADVRVFDSTRWKSFSEASENYQGLLFPTFVISNEEDISRWLTFLPEDHDVCEASKVDDQLGILIVRMYARNYERGELLRRSLLDPTTGVFPRVELSRRLDLEITTLSQDNPLAILFLDLDYFKRVNDYFGHLAGDMVLRRVGKILQDAVSEVSAVYRTGGEEFAVLVKMNKTQALAFGEYIRNEIEEYVFLYEGKEIKITASIGIALNEGQFDEDAFLRAADAAMFQAKANGRNRVVLFDEYLEDLEHKGIDPEIKDFENRIKVQTERLTKALTSKSKRMVAQYKQEADHDGLTGLYIRRYFDRRLAREFEKARTKARSLSLMFIDLDHFGKVNKTYGFPTGDQTLRKVAGQIKNTIRAVDWSARYGGEEFCVVLPDTDEKQACEIAERVWKEIGREPVESYDGRKFTITASIGVAELIPADTDITDFVQRTSDRTRYAKEHGRNQICCHD